MNDKKLVALIALILALAYPAYCCTCAFGKIKQKYCDADWVSHAKIVNLEIVNTTDHDDAFPYVQDVKYTIKFLKVFKYPEELNSTALPTTVYTPAEDGLCGIFLDKGKEYLLSGSYYNGTMTTNLCLQILFDDKHKSMENDILLWAEVPKTTVADLTKKKHDPCPKRLI
ncbi:unnamed protein product [Bursaphelenchus xylophilus]|uniref:(pine wood nematode) hypothetical protein n=1 Tax=Bursaphelenchus xylophilus TaxID=6326 RepID=A0A1I7RXR2_BURXY|nr:unnamed protein product [Bursaphelenchus xylophilus]CAG9126671.1 unnamed protein product [Bursaphelenchus xylophilus]